ncbi:SH2 domain-containing protein 3C [Trichogramma pretiosum]|uniref:SH2 domain-containing protein 3C n=1 Tax=Trichogramma pretiosum TaxID=7493 RepID=UPI000C718F88|nr:SH2 domain-containing protein 3C [Trichogramma pretiosum]
MARRTREPRREWEECSALKVAFCVQQRACGPPPASTASNGATSGSSNSNNNDATEKSNATKKAALVASAAVIQRRLSIGDVETSHRVKGCGANDEATAEADDDEEQLTVDPTELVLTRHRMPVNATTANASVRGSVSACSSPRASVSAESSEELVRRLLERELRLFDLIDPRDLRSYAWYHGSTLPGGRKGAEAEIPNDGDFLVRDCASQPGNYVLSVRHRGQPLHFVINKMILQPNTVYERVQYRFEDEAFDTVADLITFYVGSKRPISQASGARIVTPRHRKVPLASASGFLLCPSASSSSSSLSTSTATTNTSHRSPPHVPRKKERSMSLSGQQHYQSPPPPQMIPLHQIAASQMHASGNNCSRTLPRVPSSMMTQSISCSHSLDRQKIGRVVTDPALKFQQLQRQQLRQLLDEAAEEPHYQTPRNNSVVIPAGLEDDPPPKPPRVPRHLKPATGSGGPPYPYPASSLGKARQASGSDSGNGSGDSESSSNGGGSLNNGGAGASVASLPMQPAMRGIILRSYQQAKALGLNELDIKQWEELEKKIMETTPNFEIASVLEPDFQTVLLPNGEHKPLDAMALRGISCMLTETASRILAQHLTKIDVDMLLKVYVEEPPSVREGQCGLELLVQPYARQTRLDVIERTECLKLVVGVTVLICQTPAERAAMISRWIQVAIDTKTALGNLYGFCGVMLGLCLPQIQRLAGTWHLLRQKHTDEAFTFEAKLRPTLRAMNECTDPQAPNTTIPHILPIALLNERTQDDVLGKTPPSALAAAVLSPWENSAADCGLSIMWAHLEASRKMTESLTLFRRNAEIALDGLRSDELVLDAFRTEFQMRFLWGSRGSAVTASERHAKFIQVLDAMYDKCAATEQI